MMDLLVKDLDTELTEAATEEKNAQEEYDKTIADAKAERVGLSKSLKDKSAAKADIMADLGDRRRQGRARGAVEVAQGQERGKGRHHGRSGGADRHQEVDGGATDGDREDPRRPPRRMRLVAEVLLCARGSTHGGDRGAGQREGDPERGELRVGGGPAMPWHACAPCAKKGALQRPFGQGR